MSSRKDGIMANIYSLSGTGNGMNKEANREC